MKDVLTTAVVLLACASCGPGVGAPCSSAQDCSANLICDADTNLCAAGTCGGINDSCGKGARCDVPAPIEIFAESRCVHTAPGGGCSVDEHCVVGEFCLGRQSQPCGVVIDNQEDGPCCCAVEGEDWQICDEVGQR